jgi:drug/metabolite transporter (DMT)-like permease
MRTKGFLYIICAGVLWGFVGPLSKIAFQEGVSPLEVAFWRAFLAWLFFGLHASVTKEVRVNPRDVPAIVIFGLTGVAFFYGSYQLAVHKGGAALASMLLYTAPAWVALLSRLFFKEAMTSVKIAATVLTIFGVIGVSTGAAGESVYSGIQVSSAAVVFGLLSGFFYSLYYIFGKRFSANYTSPNLFLYMLPIGALCLLPAVSFSHKTITAWIAIGGLAFFSTYVAYYCYYLALKYLEPSRAAITATIEPIVATIVAHVLWKESFSLAGYAGAALILTAVILIVRDGTREGKASSYIKE